MTAIVLGEIAMAIYVMLVTLGLLALWTVDQYRDRDRDDSNSA